MFVFPFTVQAEDIELKPQEEIAEAPALEPMREEQLNDLLGEEMYLGENDWRGNKVSTNRDYSKIKNKDTISHRPPLSSCIVEITKRTKIKLETSSKNV